MVAVIGLLIAFVVWVALVMGCVNMIKTEGRGGWLALAFVVIAGAVIFFKHFAA